MWKAANTTNLLGLAAVLPLPGLSDDGAFDPDMREALANATQR